MITYIYTCGTDFCFSRLSCFCLKIKMFVLDIRLSLAALKAELQRVNVWLIQHTCAVRIILIYSDLFLSSFFRSCCHVLRFEIFKPTELCQVLF